MHIEYKWAEILRTQRQHHGWDKVEIIRKQIYSKF